MTGHTTGHTIGHTDVLPEGADTDAILREIQQAVRATSERPVLKTVTIKMLPELDARVEQHCRETGRKKQDVIRDALRLYFAALEARPPEG
ncbi:MAG: ribbon-helix-helix protein, CopG family [Chthonomonadaceae bacterium]|nr:ribbon-helix-helix protein, CopG family [Chthonomonadaceae bacterium]